MATAIRNAEDTVSYMIQFFLACKFIVLYRTGYLSINYNMSQFYTVDTTEIGSKRWLMALKRLRESDLDLHIHPDYARIYEETYNEKAICHILESDEFIVLQVAMIRKIGDGGYSDISSVYGYGGPYFSGTSISADLIHSFNAQRKADLRKLNLVSEVCMISPLDHYMTCPS